MIIVIETERLILREYVLEDFEAQYEILSDMETMQHYPAPYDVEMTKHWIEWNFQNYKKYGFGIWAIVLKETGKFIGDCGITIQNIDGQLLPEIGYHIHKKYWKKGYGSEAAKAVRDWAFENTKYDALYTYMKYTNAGSCSTAIAIGMKKVKEYSDEKNRISYVYSITREDWERGDSRKVAEVNNMTIAQMTEKMIAYSNGNVHDIDHFLRVWSYAKMIGELEGLDEKTQFILEVGAITHDIACPLCREKYGDADGKHQEKEGAPLVKEFLADSGLSVEQIDRVSFLVGHHHTLSDIEGMDYQILIEADYIVNALENGYDREIIKNFMYKNMRTKSGIRIIKSIFALNSADAER